MAKYLTQEWLDEPAGAGPGVPRAARRHRPDAVRVTGGPDGDVKYYWVVENGKLLESTLGDDVDAEFTLTLVLRRLGARSRRASSTPTPPSCRAA